MLILINLFVDFNLIICDNIKLYCNNMEVKKIDEVIMLIICLL